MKLGASVQSWYFRENPDLVAQGQAGLPTSSASGTGLQPTPGVCCNLDPLNSNDYVVSGVHYGNPLNGTLKSQQPSMTPSASATIELAGFARAAGATYYQIEGTNGTYDVAAQGTYPAVNDMAWPVGGSPSTYLDGVRQFTSQTLSSGSGTVTAASTRAVYQLWNPTQVSHYYTTRTTSSGAPRDPAGNAAPACTSTTNVTIYCYQEIVGHVGTAQTAGTVAFVGYKNAQGRYYYRRSNDTAHPVPSGYSAASDVSTAGNGTLGYVTDTPRPGTQPLHWMREDGSAVGGLIDYFYTTDAAYQRPGALASWYGYKDRGIAAWLFTYPSMTAPSQVRKYVHARQYTDDPAAGGELISEEWAQPSSDIARTETSDSVMTRRPVSCSYSYHGCAEFRMRSKQADAMMNTDLWTRYRGTSAADRRVPVAGDLSDIVQSATGRAPDGSGPIGNVRFPWQTLPPGAGSTYAYFDRTDVVALGGTAVDGPNGEVNTPQTGEHRVRLVIDNATRLPIRETVYSETNELLSRRLWTYDSALMRDVDLSGDFFAVSRPTTPDQEKIVEYTTPPDGGLLRGAAQSDTTAPPTQAVDAATGAEYERLSLGARAVVADDRYCVQSTHDSRLVERPAPNQIPHADGTKAGVDVMSRSVATYLRQPVSAECPEPGAAGEPALIVRTTAAGSPLATMWEHAYREMSTPATSLSQPNPFGEVREVIIDGQRQEVPILALGKGRHGMYLEKDETASVITGTFDPSDVDQLVSYLGR